jgi:hypothetical protein
METKVSGGILVGPCDSDIFIATNGFPNLLRVAPEDIQYHCGGSEVAVALIEIGESGFSFHLRSDTTCFITWTYFVRDNRPPTYHCSSCHQPFTVALGERWTILCSTCEKKETRA